MEVTALCHGYLWVYQHRVWYDGLDGGVLKDVMTEAEQNRKELLENSEINMIHKRGEEGDHVKATQKPVYHLLLSTLMATHKT